MLSLFAKSTALIMRERRTHNEQGMGQSQAGLGRQPDHGDRRRFVRSNRCEQVDRLIRERKEFQRLEERS